MIVFGIGLPRTGTSSLRTAMEILGFNVITDPYGQTYRALMEGREGSLLIGHHVYISEPCYAFVPQLARKYPDALFIDTPRQYSYWEKSISRYWENMGKPCKRGLGCDEDPCLGLLYSLKDGYILPDLQYVWTEHDRQVQESVPLFKLLRLRVCEGEGWAPLCIFLGRSAPMGLKYVKFPKRT